MYHELFLIGYDTIFSGNVDDNINFTYGSKTEVFMACVASLDGVMFILGGRNRKRQVNT